MQINEEKPKYIHKRKPKTGDSGMDVVVSSGTEEGKSEKKEISEEKKENAFKSIFTRLGIKTQRALAKFGIWAGIISMTSGAGSANACRPIPANPFLIGLGLMLIVASLLYLLWTFFN